VFSIFTRSLLAITLGPLAEELRRLKNALSRPIPIWLPSLDCRLMFDYKFDDTGGMRLFNDFYKEPARGLRSTEEFYLSLEELRYLKNEVVDVLLGVIEFCLGPACDFITNKLDC
jgi:hypothetical protein